MKLKFFAASLVTLGLTSAALAQTAPLPVALTAAVGATQAAKAPYAFDFSFASTKATIRAHYDPSATPHVTMLDPSEGNLSGDQRSVLNTLQGQLDGLSWCAGERMGHVSNMRLLREDADSATYSFQPTRESTRGQASQYAEHLRGEMTLTKANPDVTGLHIFLAAPFDPLPLVHITAFDVAVTCATAPNGRRYASHTVALTTGSAFGQNINERNVQNVSGVAAAS